MPLDARASSPPFRFVEPGTGTSRAVRRLRRGFVRLGIGLAVLWFVFWTCAYVMRPLASEGAQSLPALSPTTDIALIAVAIVGLPWIASGFRSN
jgi:hypothetical protein